MLEQDLSHLLFVVDNLFQAWPRQLEEGFVGGSKNGQRVCSRGRVEGGLEVSGLDEIDKYREPVVGSEGLQDGTGGDGVDYFVDKVDDTVGGPNTGALFFSTFVGFKSLLFPT